MHPSALLADHRPFSNSLLGSERRSTPGACPRGLGVTRLFALALLVLPAVAAGAAPAEPDGPARRADILGRRSLRAVRIVGAAPRIDGKPDEPVWSTAPIATDFVESQPRPAALASLVSRARVLVDDDAIYIGLEYDDPTPRTIVAPLARRDDETTSDFAFVEIDSRHDRQSGFSFGVNPRGVLVDGAWLGDTNYDSAWNAVWEAAAAIGPHGWTAEFRIPFSQLSFALPSGTQELVWGINFYRYSPGHAEGSNWSPRYSSLAGVVSNFNDLIVPAPPRVRRFEATPYLLGRGGHTAGDEDPARGGGDLQAGVGPSFRLTATVLPDFGQVEADPSQVNLSAFELFQSERRPFFLEGLDLFRFDTGLAYSVRDASFENDQPFYSRRVGGAPPGRAPDGVTEIARPLETTILGAAKLSGQTAGGWTLGAFTALSDREFARVRDQQGHLFRVAIVPRTALAIARGQRNFNADDTTLGLYGSRVERDGMDDRLAGELVRSASTLGVDLRHRFGGRNYELRAWLLGSEVAGSDAAVRATAEAPRHLFQRPDGGEDRARLGGSLGGLAGQASVARVNGRLRWSLVGRAVSPGFDIAETGYQQTSDWLLLSGTWRYEKYPSGGPLRNWAVGSETAGAGWTWSGDLRSAVVSAFGSLATRHTATAKLTITHELEALSIGWLRGGPALLLPPRDALALSLATNQSRPTYGTLEASVAQETGSDSWSASLSPLWNVRSSDALQWSIGPSLQVETLGWQPVGSVPLAGEPRYLVARVVQRTAALTLRADWVFSPRLSLQLYAQPFATVGRYDRYQLLRAPRAASPGARFAPLCVVCVAPASGGNLALDLDGDGRHESLVSRPDGEQRSLNASAVLRWEYRPGSFLTLVWNQHREGLGADVERSATQALGDLANDRGHDVILAKVSWRFGPSG